MYYDYTRLAACTTYGGLVDLLRVCPIVCVLGMLFGEGGCDGVCFRRSSLSILSYPYFDNRIGL